jgi:hypothetical protein
MTQVAIDVTVMIDLEPGHIAEEIVERLTAETIPRCFAHKSRGDSVFQSQILAAVQRIPGVRSAEIVRFCRAAGGGPNVPPEGEVCAAKDEHLALGRLEVGVRQA